MSEQLKFFKGNETNLPAEVDQGAIYHCEDTGNTYLGGEENKTTRFSSAVGKTILNDNSSAGEIFNDYENNVASGKASHAEGYHTVAFGNYSHAEGYYTVASGQYSHAEGSSTKASGARSHAEGDSTTASGSYSHAEGESTTASDLCSHAEGRSTTASGDYSHAEGERTTASGYCSHAEGNETAASSYYSHAEGNETVASGNASHVEGDSTMASGQASHAEGCGKQISVSITGTAKTTTYTLSAANIDIRVGQVIGYNNICAKITDYSSSVPSITVDKTLSTTALTNASAYIYTQVAFGNYSHAEGYYTVASGEASHAEGESTIASGYSSHAEGGSTIASSYYSHAEGYKTTASGTYSHAEGYYSTASGYCSHAEGKSTTASGDYSHAEGARTTASGYCSHAEGDSTIASSYYSHVEGNETAAFGNYSHAEGYYTVASGEASHAEGYQTAAVGNYSHAEGYWTEADGDNSHVQGTFNIRDAEGRYAHIVGNGERVEENGQYTTTYSNAHTLDWDGNAWFAGDVYIGGTSQDDAMAISSAFAPAGYGLGSNSPGVTESTIDGTVLNGWYAFVPTAFITLCNITFRYGHLHVDNFDGNAARQTLYIINGNNIVLRRERSGGVWGEWECENPPMEVGVEYRTTKRYNGRAVFCKLVDVGTLPNATYAYISTGVPVFEYPFFTHVEPRLRRDNIGTFDYLDDSMYICTLFRNSALWHFKVSTTSDKSAYSLRIYIEYIKTHDTSYS